MVYKEIIVLITIGVLGFKRIDCQIAPANPCPNVFNYFKNNDNGEVYGKLEFQNDGSGFYELSVNMSVAVYLREKKNIRLDLKTSASDLSLGKPVVYHVQFPTQQVLPKPTRIELNNRVYCNGPTEEVRPGSGVTNMWATTYFGTSLPFEPTKSNIGNTSLATAETLTNVPSHATNVANQYVPVHKLINGGNLEDGQTPLNVDITHTQNIVYKTQVRNGVLSNATVITGNYSIVKTT